MPLIKKVLYKQIGIYYNKFGGNKMSIIHTEITLRNALDVYNAEDGIIKEQDIRETTVKAFVDTGAWTLIINEETRKQLGLRTVGAETGTLADGKSEKYILAGPLEVRWKDRRTVCETLVLPDAEEILLGAILLEAMDLIIHPHKKEIVGAHGDQIIHSVKCVNGKEVKYVRNRMGIL